MPSEVRNTARIYDVLAPFYGFWAEATEARARRRALREIESHPGSSLLEVAIGTGKQLREIARSGCPARCVGVELSTGMLKRAHRRLSAVLGRGVFLCRADARALPFAHGRFDLLLNCYMLDLLPEADIPVALEEFRRVLRPNGLLVLLTMTVQPRLANAVWMWLFHHAPVLVGGCRPIASIEWLVRGGWRLERREEIRQCGFRTEFVLARPC